MRSVPSNFVWWARSRAAPWTLECRVGAPRHL